MKTIPIILLILAASIAQPAVSQNRDIEQRERDMKIAEEILSEIFSDDEEAFEFLPIAQRNIRSEYIPGYGVHFLLSANSFSLLFLGEAPPPPPPTPGGSATYRNDQDSDEEADLTEEQRLQEIRDRIHEYMLNYAPQIRGVPENEWVRVTYSPNRSRGGRLFVNGRQRNSQTNGISVWASVSDLKRFRERSISESEMLNRMKSSTIGKESEYKDLNIFASVLQTSLNSLETEHMRVTREPRMTYIPGLGARYQVNVSAGSTFILNEIEISDENFQFRLDSMSLNLEETLRMLREGMEPLARSMDSLSNMLSDEDLSEMKEDIREHREELRKEEEELREEFENSFHIHISDRSENRPDLNPDADLILEELFNVIETYGSTLATLQNDEMLMISIQWGGRDEDLPDQTELRITKGDLLDGDDPDIIEYRR